MSHEVFRQGEQSVGIAADITFISSYCDLSAIRYVVIVSSYVYFCISMFTLSLFLSHTYTHHSHVHSLKCVYIYSVTN